ncbi:MAG: hypothetical protein ACKVS6_12535 [Planctomycetota bacterium]
MAAPANRRAPAPEPKPFPVFQLVAIGVMSIVSIGLVIFLMNSNKEKPKPVEAPPVVETKPVETKPVLPSTIKEIPAADRKEIYDRLTFYSDKIDPLERREMAADKLTNAEERLAEYEALSDEYGTNREGIGEVLDDPKYEKYKYDEAYGIYWKGYEDRLKYWQGKMNSIKKKRDAAFIEVRNAKDAEKKTDK